MKAMVWKENGKIEYEKEWPLGEISDEEVLVEVKAAGVCMTDIHMIRGTLDFAKPPWILGHEMAGVVAKAGRNVRRWQVGDRVIVDPVVTCGSCLYCQSGKKYLCPDGGELGTTYGNGGYGQFVIVKPSNLYSLPDELSFEAGAMMEPMNCTLGAIERVPNMVGSRVLVFGPGPAGLFFVQLAKAYGAISVTLVGNTDEKLALGRKLGANHTLNIQSASLEHAMEQYNVVIEASGSVEAVKDAFECVEKSGTVVLYGLNGSSSPTIQSDKVVSKDLTVVTCISAPLLWNKGIDLVKSGKVRVEDMITKKASFEEAAGLINALVDHSFATTKMIIRYEA